VNKPDGSTIVLGSRERRLLMATLPVRRVPGVGKVRRRMLVLVLVVLVLVVLVLALVFS